VIESCGTRSSGLDETIRAHKRGGACSGVSDPWVENLGLGEVQVQGGPDGWVKL